jgi:outer membrane receptor protein involved in Fe transport
MIIAAVPIQEMLPGQRHVIVPGQAAVSRVSAMVPRRARPASGAAPAGEITEVAEADIVVEAVADVEAVEADVAVAVVADLRRIPISSEN